MKNDIRNKHLFWVTAAFMVLSNAVMLAGEPQIIGQTNRLGLADSLATLFQRGQRNAIKIDPGRLIGVAQSGLRLSYERHYLRRWSTQLSFIQLYRLGGLLDAGFTGFGFGAQQRYYFRLQGAKGFIAFDTEHTSERITTTWEFNVFPYIDTTALSYSDTINVQRRITVLAPSIGMQTTLSKGLVFDISIGVGFRHRVVSHSDRKNPADDMGTTRHPNVKAALIRPGNSWRLAIPIQLGIGYTF